MSRAVQSESPSRQQPGCDVTNAAFDVFNTVQPCSTRGQQQSRAQSQQLFLRSLTFIACRALAVY